MVYNFNAGPAILPPAVLAKAQAELSVLIAERRRLEKAPPGLTEWSTSPTPEGLQRVMATNWGRAAVFTDEGGLIGTLAGRYAGDHGADMDPFLSGFVGGPLRSPRAGSDRPHVEAAYLSMGMAVQPKVIEDLASVKGAEERGLLARFLFAVCRSMVGTRMYGDSQAINPTTLEGYARALRDWAVWPGNPEDLACIGLEPQAYAAYEKFHDDIEVRQGPGGDLHQQFIVSKIAGTTLRIAGLFHCFDLGRVHGLADPISEDAVLRAVQLSTEFFIPHALSIARQMRSTGPQGVEARILSWVRKKGCREFRRRDLANGIAGSRGSVKSLADLIDPLAGLVEDGYLRPMELEGRGGPAFKVNPRFFEAPS